MGRRSRLHRGGRAPATSWSRLIGRRDGGDAVDVVGIARRRSEGHVERLRQLPRLGQEETGNDLEVAEICPVVRARYPSVRDRGRDIDAKLEAAVEGQIELEQSRVLVAVVEEAV